MTDTTKHELNKKTRRSEPKKYISKSSNGTVAQEKNTKPQGHRRQTAHDSGQTRRRRLHPGLGMPQAARKNCHESISARSVEVHPIRLPSSAGCTSCLGEVALEIGHRLCIGAMLRQLVVHTNCCEQRAFHGAQVGIHAAVLQGPCV